MERLSLTVSVIGAGSMGGAIARGLVASGTLAPGQLTVFDLNQQAVAPLVALGMASAASAPDAVAAPCDVVILAVKPQVLPSVMAELAPHVAGRLVVSIAAGVTLATLEEGLPGARVVRVMPNLPLQVLSGATAVCPGTQATVSDTDIVRTLFGALGSAQVMTESQLDVAGAVSGCGPAYFALFVDDLTRAGVRLGLPAAACRDMVLATMRGVAQQLLESGEHPRAYMERVTSPGGTTAAGLEAMEWQVFQACSEAVDAALERTRELAEG